MSLEWKRDTGKVAFIDVGRLAGREQERFSETCVQKEDEETAQLIKTSQSVCTMPRI